MNTSDLIRRYWAGAYHFEHDNELQEFINKEKWKIDQNKKDKKSYLVINEIKIGDFFALKSFGENYDLNIIALGIVIGITDKPYGELDVKWLKFNQLHKIKTSKYLNTNNWFSTLLEVKRVEEIAEIFDPLFQPQDEEIRAFTANSDAFEFWNDEREDIYQDYLKKTK